MPINPNIPEAFIAAYVHFNHPELTAEETSAEPTLASRAADWLYSKSTAITGKTMTPTTKGQSIKTIINLFTPELSPDDWINLTFTLGNTARLHQEDKAQNDESKLSKAVHAARSYIVACLKTGLEYQPHYFAKLDALKKELTNLDESIKKNRRLPNHNVTDLYHQREMLLITLTYLGDEEATDRSVDYGYFNFISKDKHQQVNIPPFLKLNYHDVFCSTAPYNQLQTHEASFIDRAEGRTLPFSLKAHTKSMRPTTNLKLLPTTPAQPESSEATDTEKPQSQPGTASPPEKKSLSESSHSTESLSEKNVAPPADLPPKSDKTPLSKSLSSEDLTRVRTPSPAPSVTSPMGSFPAPVNEPSLNLAPAATEEKPTPRRKRR